ncbi:MAG TPA: PIG-L family deacetylase [Fimbriimonas sp.]
MALQVLCIGAHPDDCEGSVGGTIALFCRRGDRVKVISATEGSRGHYEPAYLENPDLLIDRRRAESLAAARAGGYEFETLGFRDGDVYVDRDSTEAMVRAIRRAGEPGRGPDLVLMNRPSDYHRDHRYTAQLVLDATYMLTVPFLCPDVPAIRRMPVFAYWQDGFTEYGEFRADVVVAIDETIAVKREMMLAHESQYLEWLPYNAEPGSALYGLPEEEAPRRQAVAKALDRRSAQTAARHADRLPEGTTYAEAFQISEYGRRPSSEELTTMFPTRLL